MAAPPSTSPAFTVTRQEPELVAPAKRTPYEFKPLSDIDDQEGLRFQITTIQFYRHHPFMRGEDPVKVIRVALAKTLVFYYPFAGRLRELQGPHHNRKLVVECTGEGVIFIEADADVTLDQYSAGHGLHPPFPCLDELLFDVPGSAGVLNCPLLLIQVTRMKCGGFIFAIRLNHTISDAAGLVQFMTAVGEMSRGASVPSVLPEWGRELLSARSPPHVTCTHHEYDEVTDRKRTTIPLNDMTHRSFFFGPTEASALRRFVPQHLRSCSTFEVLTACIWRCRTIAIQPDPTEEVRVVCIVNARSKFNPPLPKGYYGNAIAYPVALTTAEKLCQNPLGYALELVRKAKNEVTEDYMKSVADLMVLKGRPPFTADRMVLKGRPHFTVVRTYLVSDVRRAGFGEVDFGWGKAAYGGPAAKGGVFGVSTFYIPFKNDKGENGILVPIWLAAPAMERFVKELDNYLKDYPNTVTRSANTSNFIKSVL